MRVSEARLDRPSGVEERLARPMFALAALFLVLVAVVIHVNRTSPKSLADSTVARGALVTLGLLWPVFVIEGVVRFRLVPPERRTRRMLAATVATILIPPLRLAAPSSTRPGFLWLPWAGWQKIGFDLNKTLQRCFAGPMFVIALLILPVLAVEYFWADAVQTYPVLKIALGAGASVIWLAFATEFIIRFSAAEKKLNYAVANWVDIAVVLLPALEFLPFLRILQATRIMRLNTLARMAKYYRLYGLAGKGWQGLVVLELLQRSVSRSPEARLSRLRGRLEEKREEIRELEREVDYYRRRIEAIERERSGR